MIDVITRDPSRMGPLATGQGVLIRAGVHGAAYLEMQAVRVADDVCRLAPGDVVIMYTDGLYERRDEAPDEHLAELARLAASFSRLPLTEMSRALTDGMLDGTAPQDDICVLVAAPQ